jgi:hypothetical protein
MRRFGVATALLALAGLLGAPVVQAGPATVFSGSWSSTDPVDGSAQHLDVKGGTAVSIVYTDEFGFVCVNLGAPTVLFTGRLTGAIDGSVMRASFKIGGCGPVKEVTARLSIIWTFVYDESTDTLFGPFEDGPTRWYRD